MLNWLSHLTAAEWRQIGIFCCGFPALLMVSYRIRYGFLLGLLGQPIWIAFGWYSGAWGVFFLTCAYTVSWSLGVYNHFSRRGRRKQWAKQYGLVHGQVQAALQAIEDGCPVKALERLNIALARLECTRPQ